MRGRKLPLSAALPALLVVLAALLVPTSAEASRTSGWSAAAAPQAPTALASEARSDERALAPDAHAVERALALGDARLDEGDAPRLALFAGDELHAQQNASALRFAPLEGLQLLDDDLAAQLATKDEPSYPETRVRGFDFLGQEVVGVESELSLTLHWGSGAFGLELASGSGEWLSEDPAGTVDSPSLYAFVGNRPNLAVDPLGLGQNVVVTASGGYREEDPQQLYKELVASGLSPKQADWVLQTSGNGGSTGANRVRAIAPAIGASDKLVYSVMAVGVGGGIGLGGGLVAGGALALGAAGTDLLVGATTGVGIQGGSDVASGQFSGVGQYFKVGAAGAVTSFGLGLAFRGAGLLGPNPGSIAPKGAWTSELDVAPSAVAHRRSVELQNSLPPGSKGRVTMSAGVSEKPDGSRYVAVGTSEPRGYLRRGVELKPDEVLMPGGEHAEEDVVGGTLALGDKPVAVGAGRPHCPKCVEAIEKASAATASPRRQ